MAKTKKTGLGGGVNSLFFSNPEDAVKAEKAEKAENSEVIPGKTVVELNINDIEPGEGQPRKNFDKEKIEQLAESIKEHGVIQPIIVTKQGNIYRIIAGERRWRAARKAGLTTIPAIEKTGDNKEIMEMALIENLQREDLNPIEEAEAYEKLMSEYSMTQEELSKEVSKSRPAIANKMRLLGLGKETRNMLVSGELTEGHARCLLSIENPQEQLKAANTVVNLGFSVRQTEKYVKTLAEKAKKAAETEETAEKEEKFADSHSIAVKTVQNRLKQALGTKVTLKDANGKGQIIIDYYSEDERERLIELLTEEKR